ncbi:hypothetical protein C5167_010343 [Papaver somniferum]|uniref:Chalcone-flavanone isomerase family protein n=1 Tax=Papaver somniferum TaxID=3469 RepID=A0A4Y7K3V0_PAPSO|nr:YTH domain-containing protein 1-like [Papaver somniferum]RZC66655.1 hypothetical protein C5167_010343 [Papaver somniferum]
METPSSIRRITRSQAKASVINAIPMSRKNEESEKSVTRQKKPERSALTDISNDSPIVGLAMGCMETPSSFIKKLDQPKKTPGSGEALLRYQVKSLLQKVEEEAELSKLTFENRPFIQGIANSPSALLAPANTPQVLNLSCNDMNMNVDAIISESRAQVQEESKNHQMAIDEPTGNTLESQKSLITRLLFDFPEKLESSDSSSSPGSSVLTNEESNAEKDKSTDEDDASVWSIQVNASTKDEDEEGEIEEVEQDEEECYDDEEEEYEDVEDGGFLDDLCDGLSKITVQEKKLPEFEGKHTRFIYNSDGEIEGEEDISVSPSKLRLKGLPVPEGKHLRFPDEE